MSVSIEIDTIPIELRRKMLTDLKVKALAKDGKNVKFAKTESFDIYTIDEDNVIVPFAYYFQKMSPDEGFPNAHIMYPKSKATFNIPLFDRQREIRDDALRILNDTHSLMGSMATGFGKTLFAIYLACKIGLKTVIFAGIRLIIVDQWKKSIIKACGEGANIQVLGTKTQLDPDADFYIINTANVTKRSREDFSQAGLLIADECLIKDSLIVTDQGNIPIKKIHDMNIALRPKALSFNQNTLVYEFKQITNSWRTIKQEAILEVYLGKKSIKCTGGHRILTNGGYVCARDLIAGDLIVCSGDDSPCISYTLLPVQWVSIYEYDSSHRFVYDIEVEGNHNFVVSSDDTSQSGPTVHNCHTLCTPKYAEAFGYIFPKYVIGLTATPVRTDGHDLVIELYCGPNIIYKPLNAMFNAYLIPTGFAPVIKKTESGDLNWNAVLASQATSQSRNELLLDIVRYFGHRNILVACKRKDQANILHLGLKKYEEDSDVYFGSDVIVNYQCRILVVTYSKAGCGFDHPKLDMLLVAGDAEESFMQYLGRVFRREWHFPIVIDPVDKFWPLMKHSKTRQEIYTSSGGEVKKFEKWFPCFQSWRKQFGTDLTDIYEELGVSSE